MLDKRLKGLTKVSQITHKFVRDNMTKEERNTTYTKRKVVEKTLYYEEDADNFDDLIRGVSHHMQKVVALMDRGCELKNHCDLEVVRYTETITTTITPEEHFHDLWRKQLKEHLASTKEYNQYLALKSKFEGEGSC